MKIALFDMTHWNKENVSNLLQEHELQMFDNSIHEEDLEKIKDVECLCVFISSHINSNILEALPNVKLIATMSTGFDHIERQACEKRGITICNVPYYGENTIAEQAFALLLCIVRKIIPSVERTRMKQFSTDGLQGSDLSGKTIGLIGGGHIGMHAMKIAKGFNMNVLVYDINVQQTLAKIVGFEYVPLEELYKRSDIISIHVPYNQATHHLVNQHGFEHMSPGCVFINTSRGAVVDTKALLRALEKGIVSAAGLDVLEGEESIGKENPDQELLKVDEKLLGMENVIITPHNAFNTKEALGRIEQTTADNINAFIDKNATNVVKF